MGGRRREPLELLEAKGKTHMGRAAKAERAASDVKTPEVKQVRAPDWLPSDLRKDFNDYAKRLVGMKIFDKLDRDTLARYLVAHQVYQAALNHVEASISEGDSFEASRWSTVQARYYSQCRECANDLGLTITSRCRLVVPEAGGKEETAFEKMMRERQGRGAG